MKSFNSLVAPLLIFSTGCVAPNLKEVNSKSVRKSASDSNYAIKGLCAGLPRVISVKTDPGFCLGLLDNGENLVKPRYALQIDATRILLTDMGGWKANAGSLHLLTQKDKSWKRELLLSGHNIPLEKKCVLNGTQQLIQGPDKLIYVTSSECVATLDSSKEDLISTLTIQISNLPTDGLHASKVIAFDDKGDILMNVGSRTDNCEDEASEICQETIGPNARGVIRKYSRQEDGTFNPEFSIFAQGQRNSLGMFWDDNTQSLWTAENARDYINRVDTRLNGQEHPADELNVIQENAVLDWPYCYDSGLKSPEFPKADCNSYQKPQLLFPAHSAPLSILMYTGNLFPKWYQKRLLISFHGYEAYGHRIVTYKRDDRFLPSGEPLSIVYDWGEKGSQKIGSPVGITQALDGSILIVEDNSQKILKLFYDAKEGNGTAVAELNIGTDKKSDSALQKEFLRTQKKRQDAFNLKLKEKDVPLFTQIQNKLIDQNCVVCHGGLNYPGIQILPFDDIGNYKKLSAQLLLHLKGDGVPRMPPFGLPENTKKELIELVEKWVAAGRPSP